MLGFAVLTPTYLEHAARMRFGCDRSDFFRDDYLEFPLIALCKFAGPLLTAAGRTGLFNPR